MSDTRKAVRNARRTLRSEICNLQRVTAGMLVLSVAGNTIMYGIMSRKEAIYQAQLETMQKRVELADKVKEQALEQYGGLVLELQRHSREKEQQAAQERKREEETEPSYTYVGQCRITYYCCEQYPHICGNGDGVTATGTAAEPGIVAVDPNVIPLGSTVIIDGAEYIAADTGGAIKGYRVDVCTDTHAHALELGTHRADVWIVKQ